MPGHAQPACRQQGAATLVVVMVLFFVMAMMAAFANRNLAFEQRIAGNYYRAGLALETAEAGGDWVLSQLNGASINALCADSSAPDTSFRERYLNIGKDRVIQLVKDDDAKVDPYVAACINTDATGWVCQCPIGGLLTSPAPGAADRLQPMFAMHFDASPRAGVARVRVESCTDVVRQCALAPSAANASLARTLLVFDVALVSALKVPPAAPLIARGAVDLGVTGLGLHNADPAVGGLLLQAGLGYQGNTSRLSSVPGTPVRDALISGDLSLRVREHHPEDMFRLFFGMAPATYRQQPAMHELSCNGDCGGALQQAYARGEHMLWIEGPAHISGNLMLGTTSEPFLLVVNGKLTLEGPMLLNGLIYARGNASWTHGIGTQPAVLTGALLSEGDVSAIGPVDIAYHAGLINTLSNQRGSFVRVPGSWSDGSE